MISAGEPLKRARGWVEDEARQMLVGGINERRPEMAGAAAVAREDLGEEEARVWRRGRRCYKGKEEADGCTESEDGRRVARGWPAAVVTGGAP